LAEDVKPGLMDNLQKDKNFLEFICKILSACDIYFSGTRFELRALYLLDRYSTALAILPALFCSGYFGNKVLLFV
jgi:hypothetical protein